MSERQTGIGTRAKFQSWLSTQKRLTYSAYRQLSIETKAVIWAEYKKVKQP